MNQKKKVVSNREKSEQRIKDSLLTVQNPKKTAIIFALVWQTLLLAFAIGMYFVNEYGWAGNFNTSFIIGLILAIFWVVLKLGLFEGARLKFKNYSNSKIVDKMDINSKNIKLNLDQYRELNKQRSWYGIYLMLAINVIGIIATLPFII